MASQCNTIEKPVTHTTCSFVNTSAKLLLQKVFMTMYSKHKQAILPGLLLLESRKLADLFFTSKDFHEWGTFVSKFTMFITAH